MANKIPVKAIYTGTDVTALGEYASTDTIDSTYLDTGTSANQIVQLDGTAKLPAVDGSNLTNMASGTPEGTAILSTGEIGGTKYLREDGDGTCSWQAVAGGGIGEFISSSIAISSDNTALANDDGTVNSNIAIGSSVLRDTTAGNYNTAIGYYAGTLGTNSTYNVLLGNYAGYSVTGSHNMFSGWRAGQDNTSGSNNIGLGQHALRGNTTSKLTGAYNTGIGYQAGYSLSTGQYNILNGYQAGYALTTGSSNILNGYGAGKNLTAGQYNIAMGVSALRGTLSSSAPQNCIAIGYEALKGAISTTQNCVAIGFQAGLTDTAANKLHIANNSTESLIEGDFSARTLTINGALDAEALTVNGAAIGGGVNLTSSATAPASPSAGDQWFDTANGILYAYMTDGTDSQWLDISSANGQAAAGGGGGAMEFISKSTITSSVASLEILTDYSLYDKFVVIASELKVSSNSFVNLNFKIGGVYKTDASYDWTFQMLNAYSTSTTAYNASNGTSVRVGSMRSTTPNSCFTMNLVGFKNGHNKAVDSVGYTDIGGFSEFCRYIGIYDGDTGVVQGLKFTPDSGNFTSGKFSLYGIKDA